MTDPEAEARIRDLVHTFYARVRTDEVLGPVFNEHIGDRWEPHLEKMCDFWSGILHATGRFRGDPIQAHARLPEIRPAHFDRWLEMFAEVARETMPDEEARDVTDRAHRMRAVLERHIATVQGA